MEPRVVNTPTCISAPVYGVVVEAVYERANARVTQMDRIVCVHMHVAVDPISDSDSACSLHHAFMCTIVRTFSGRPLTPFCCVFHDHCLCVCGQVNRTTTETIKKNLENRANMYIYIYILYDKVRWATPNLAHVARLGIIDTLIPRATYRSILL
jgi:hypothetical protein